MAVTKELCKLPPTAQLLLQLRALHETSPSSCFYVLEACGMYNACCPGNGIVFMGYPNLMTSQCITRVSRSCAHAIRGSLGKSVVLKLTMNYSHGKWRVSISYFTRLALFIPDSIRKAIWIGCSASRWRDVRCEMGVELMREMGFTTMGNVWLFVG